MISNQNYTLFYDETNNIRKYSLKEDGSENNENPYSFILGGVGFKGSSKTFDIADLHKRINFQSNANEMKFKHIGNGDFISILKSKKVSEFLDWLIESDFLIHFQITDIRYWSIVDIIDNSLSDQGLQKLQIYHRVLKDDLYSVLSPNWESAVNIFHKHGYPEIKEGALVSFQSDMLSLVEQNRSFLPESNYQMLKGVMQFGRYSDANLLTGNDPRVFIDSFAPFYMHRVNTFQNSNNVLDAEPSIQEEISKYLGDNCSFENSEQCVEIQLSDLVVGILGKAFSYISKKGYSELLDSKNNLSLGQSEALKKLSELIRLSIKENQLFVCRVLSNEDMRKSDFYLGLS